MSRSFWSLRRVETDFCESIEPLLSLYADRMASPEEMRRIETHLPGCESCREALAWMQATHRVLAARPVALPPADLHSRIAEAIAASSAAPVSQTPGLMRPARVFALRSAYAAAASLVVAGLVLSHPLWPVAGPSGTHFVPPPAHSASVPPLVKPHSLALPYSVPAHSSHSRTASVSPEPQPPAVHSVVSPRKNTAASVTAPTERVAETVPPPAAHFPPAPVQAVSHPSPVPHAQMAFVKPAEKRRTLKAPTLVTTPKLPDAPLMARHEKEPISVPIKIDPPVVVEQAPQVQTASTQPQSKLDDLRVKLAASVKAMQSVPYARSPYTARQASSSFANAAVHSLDSSDHVAVYSAIYSGTDTK